MSDSKLTEQPVKRLWRWYRSGAVWGAAVLAAVLLENLPLFGGHAYASVVLPPLAGWRHGRVPGLLVGVTVGLLRDWTASGWFGAASILLGTVGWLCGKG